MIKKYLDRKKARVQNKEENSHNNTHSENDKSEDKISTPVKSKSEQSSLTLSHKIKSEESIKMNKRKKTNQVKEKNIQIQEIDDSDKRFVFLQNQLDELKQTFNEAKQVHKKEINNVKQVHKQEIYILKKANEHLQKEVEKLNEQVKELKEFYFVGKLRKLLKRLIEYIIKNYYNSYMRFLNANKRVFFR